MRLWIYIILNILGLITIIYNFENKLQAQSNNDVKFAEYTFLTDINSQSPKKEVIYSGAISNDIRINVLEKYFEGSPLSGTANLFVEACDHFGAPKDCTTVAAIAKHETDLCRYYTSAQTHNCWGFGGPGVYRVKFNSFKEGIFKVTDVLVNQYGIEYMLDARKMEKVFCGPQDECIGWGSRINFFMDQINKLSIQMGYPSLYSLR
jgi:hypothetical protein